MPTIQTSTDRCHDSRAQSIHWHIGINRRLPDDLLSQRLVTLPVVTWMWAAVMRLYTLEECGLKIKSFFDAANPGQGRTVRPSEKGLALLISLMVPGSEASSL